MPPEQPNGDFSMKNLVMTIYGAKRTFMIWCLIGLGLGIIAAAGYFIMNKYISPPTVQGDVTVTLTLNYTGAEQALFPNGEEFSMRSFYEETGLWENALRVSNNDKVTVGDVISKVIIENPMRDEEPVANIFNLMIPSDYDIFDSVRQKKDFLQALCEEYKNFITGKYFTGVSIGMLYDQQLRVWDESNAEILWDPFRYDINFAELSARYQTLAGILTDLYSNDPNYRTPEGKSFNDYAKAFTDICAKDIASWDEKLLNNVYIRNIERFGGEAQFRIESMEWSRAYNLELVNSYNDLLTAFQQKDAQGMKIEEAVELLTAAQSHALTAADLQRQIEQMQFYLYTLRTNERMITDNSREAEAALTGFIDDLGKNQEELRAVIYDYYKQNHEHAAETAVLYSNAILNATDEQLAAGRISLTRPLMLLIGLTFIGVVIGFCATFVRKYVTETA